MSPRPFLSGLAMQGAAVALPQLRPDPWRGREATLAEEAAPPLPPTTSVSAAADAAAPKPRPPRAPQQTRPAAAALPAPPPTALVARSDPPPPLPRPVAPPVRAVFAEEPALLRPAPTARPAAAGPAAAPPADSPIPAAQSATPRFAHPAEVAARPAAPPIDEGDGSPVRPRPRAVAAAPSPPLAEPPPEPVIEVSIGRLEWRLQPPPARQPVATPPAPTSRGFAAFAALRAGLDRSRR